MVSEETIMICVDTSLMAINESSYKLQLNCVGAYCRAKLKSNPKNAIGIRTMGLWMRSPAHILYPTSDRNKIVRHLQRLRPLILGGESKFLEGIKCCHMMRDSSFQPIKLTRTLFFASGRTNISFQGAEWYGKKYKEAGVAVDVVTFSDNRKHLEWGDEWKMHLEAFVAAANNNNNSYIKHVVPDFYTLVSHVLSSFSHLDIISVASLEEEWQNEAARDDYDDHYYCPYDYATARAMELDKYNNSILLKNKNRYNISLQQCNEILKSGNRKNQDAAAHDQFVKARGMERGACEPLQLNEALLHSNEILKLDMGKNQAADDSRFHSQFQTIAAEETIMICVDTSLMAINESSYKLQLNCVGAYCRAKLKSNPKNAIGIRTMVLWMRSPVHILYPTSDLNKITRHLRRLKFMNLGGESKILEGIKCCHMMRDSSFQPIKLTRTLFFASGRANISFQGAEWYGKKYKEAGVAVDVVTFSDKRRHLEWGDEWKMHLEAFVAAANNNNNSHIKHVVPDFYTLVSHVLSSFSHLDIISLDSLEEEGQNEAARDDYDDPYYSPYDYTAWAMEHDKRNNSMKLKNIYN